MKLVGKIRAVFIAVFLACMTLAFVFVYVNVNKAMTQSLSENLQANLRARTMHIESYFRMLKALAAQGAASAPLQKLLKTAPKQNLWVKNEHC